MIRGCLVEKDPPVAELAMQCQRYQETVVYRATRTLRLYGRVAGNTGRYRRGISPGLPWVRMRRLVEKPPARITLLIEGLEIEYRQRRRTQDYRRIEDPAQGHLQRLEGTERHHAVMHGRQILAVALQLAQLLPSFECRTHGGVQAVSGEFRLG